MTFGEKVKAIRIKQGFSQFQLGEKMNISQQAVAKYEHLTEQPKLATVRKLANALGVSINDLTRLPSREKLGGSTLACTFDNDSRCNLQQHAFLNK